MASWRRRGRVLAGAVAVGVAVVAYVASGSRRTLAPPPPVTPLPPAATAQVSGGNATKTSGERRDFTVDFAEQTTYSDGRTVATGLTVNATARNGKRFVITGREGTVGQGQSSVTMTGDVVMTSADGLVAKTEAATYADGEGILRAQGPVTFERGATHGSGVGFHYDRNRDAMSILDKTTAHVAGAGADGDMDITAGAFTDARRDRYMRLEREAVIVRPAQTLAGDEVMVYLLPDTDEPDVMELRGSARILGREGFGSLREMTGRDINVDYGDDGRTVEHVTVAGDAVIVMAGGGGQPGQRLAAEWVDIALGADGAITRLVARERLVVTLPGDGAAPARTIRAAELTGDGAAGTGLTAMQFAGGVDFTESAPGGGAARQARSPSLTVALSPTGAAEAATFVGGATFEDGTLRARAPEARYAMARDTLELVGRQNQPKPTVTDTGLQVDATSLVIALATNGLTATGAVSSVMEPASARGGSGDATTPALLDATQPLMASAGALEYDSQARKAVYSGKARLWQGGTTINAERVVLDESKGDLAASGGVTSTLTLAAAEAATPPRATIARADTMDYVESTGTATYTKAAQMSGPEGDLTADRIALVVARADRSLERIEGYGSVAARVSARDARGDRLTYHAGDGRYVMTGAPVRFTEECRVTTGRTLTFFGTAGKLIVDGNEATRTVTKGGGRCTEPTPR
ncbi:MAG: LPS export ABC transporter periplasmic protein LptC [Vicinamibacterales bacterium]